MLRCSVKKKIGKTSYSFQVEGENLFEVGMELQKLSFPSITTCGKCQSELLYLRAYITDKGGYEYIKIQCAECKSSITFGKAKAQKDLYFLRKTDDGKLDWQEYNEEPKVSKKRVGKDTKLTDIMDDVEF